MPVAKQRSTTIWKVEMTRKEKVRLALELLLELFEEPYFPRTISTKKKGNAQVVINSIDGYTIL